MRVRRWWHPWHVDDRLNGRTAAPYVFTDVEWATDVDYELEVVERVGLWGTMPPAAAVAFAQRVNVAHALLDGSWTLTAGGIWVAILDGPC